jgi:pimeloyl-ACP methyl ester carboxylesterase
LPISLRGGARSDKKGQEVPDVQEGTLKGGLPYFALGHGPPLVVFPGLTPTNANPTGLGRWSETRFPAPLSRAFTVYSVNRRQGLEPGMTMADLAADYAGAIGAEFGEPVDVLGMSTGGSVAQQFAVDHPRLLRRLVLAGTAYRLGPTGREVQRRHAELAASGHYRSSLATLAPIIAESRLGQRLVGAAMWLAAPLAGMGRGWDPSDFVATLMAEDAFDLGDRLGEIRAPTLVIGGDHDRLYTPDLFRQTAERIPNSLLILYEGRSHQGTFTDRRFASDVIAFMSA